MAGQKTFGSTPHISPGQQTVGGHSIVSIFGQRDLTNGGVVNTLYAGAAGPSYNPAALGNGMALLVASVPVAFSLPDSANPNTYQGVTQTGDDRDGVAVQTSGAQITLSRGTLFNGTEWDRARMASASIMAALSGMGAQLATGPGNWSVTNAPAANTAATITRAGVAGVCHVCNSICGAIAAPGAAATPIAQLVLRDGAAGVGAILWSATHMAGLGFADEISLSGLNIVGTAGNAMTLEWTAAPGAGNFQSVALTGFDVN